MTFEYLVTQHDLFAEFSEVWRRRRDLSPICFDGDSRWHPLVCLLLSTLRFHLKESSMFMRLRKTLKCS